MSNYLSYILESTASLIILFGVYHLFLRRLHQFRFNRLFLLLSLITSFIIPLIELPFFSNAIIYQVTLPSVEILANSSPQAGTSSLGFLWWLQVAYLLITCSLFSLFSLQLYNIYRIARRSGNVIHPVNHQKVFLSKNESFSFFQWIFIKEEDINNELVYIHERQHSSQWHSLDIIFLKVLQIIFWFNPLLFLYEKELRLQHEYYVDDYVLGLKEQKNNYMQLLLNQIFNTKFNLITNNFNQTFIKNRFKMMKNKESKKLSKILLFAFLSMAIISPMVISCSMEPEEATNEKTVLDVPKEVDKPTPPVEKNEEKTFTQVDEMPVFPGGLQAMYEFLGQNIIYPEAAKKAEVTGKVFIGFIVEKDGSINEAKVIRGIGSGCDEEALRVIKMMPNWKPGKVDGKDVRVEYTMPISFKLQ